MLVQCPRCGADLHGQEFEVYEDDYGRLWVSIECWQCTNDENFAVSVDNEILRPDDDPQETRLLVAKLKRDLFDMEVENEVCARPATKADKPLAEARQPSIFYVRGRSVFQRHLSALVQRAIQRHS